ncbi:histidine biosynthesis protein [Candidatus Nitrosoglobus terrae]|uniref:Histidine biosynthesis protein n=1 Tax=Candidatus Nitrosoglobus terrae TaxID=1630141 RepID=A0A1Q2SPT4_9GAMM|nr:HisA/HisF-related TIM barrel protein [Candidatus Nitrosoglobus terrae]BAW81126.1 histidine biosynthesis protein [Candidatus Nitrosoglobus terrae]
MKLLPVLDLMNNLVVHAKGGRREHYLPLISPFSAHSSPLEVIAGLLEWYPFSHLYLADLDGIMGRGHHRSVIAAIVQNYPKLKLWVDGGAVSCEAILQLFALGVAYPVVGTESLPDIDTWQKLRRLPMADQLVLSLDYRDGHFLGSAELSAQPELWPETVIVMSLGQIGTQKGPDWALLNEIKQKRLQQGGLFAAGGVVCLKDLQQLVRWGADGVLLASALYNGNLSAEDLIQCAEFSTYSQ